MAVAGLHAVHPSHREVPHGPKCHYKTGVVAASPVGMKHGSELGQGDFSLRKWTSGKSLTFFRDHAKHVYH
jgi:hypothetical protein